MREVIANDYPRPALRDIVEIFAVDWAIHEGQRPRNSEWTVVKGFLYGEVIHMSDDGITIAPQVFVDSDVRGALTVPWVTIGQITILQHAPTGDAP